MSKIYLDTQQNKEDKIREIVKNYIKVFPREFEMWKHGMAKKKTDMELDNPLGKLEADDVIQQALVEMPETLYGLLKQGLTVDEWDWLFAHGEYAGSKSKGDAKHEGLRWFAKEFPVFRLGKL